MEFGSAASGFRTRKEKPHKKHKGNEPEDITNKLPESLISRILSFLPTKDALRTSVLSKRWMYRWISITKLDLDDNLLYLPKRRTGGILHFKNFVTKALLLTKVSSVESFSLLMAFKYDISLLNSWISSILIPQKIKYLRIHSKCEWAFSPLAFQSLFNSVFLEELELHMFCCDIEVPTKDVYFGSLRYVNLSDIKFTGGSSSSYLSLTLPLLEKFETRNCDWLGARGVIVKAPLLESIYIVKDRIPSSHELCSCEIKFSDCHLNEFSFCGYAISQPLTLSDPSVAENASANIILSKWEDGTPEAGLRAFVLLKQFSRAKCIKFNGSEVLTQPNVAVLPEFSMLSYLELSLITCEVLLGLLQRSPVLKTLVFKGIFKFDLGLLNSAAVPECLASTLQVLQFKRVNGYKHELFLAKFFMENGMVLERMSFSLASPELSKSKIIEEFKKKLFSFKRGFSFAIVDFSYD